MAKDSSRWGRKAASAQLRRIEELLRFVPLPDSTRAEVRQKLALLRTMMLEQRAPTIALVGRRGAGKSSLVNAIFGELVAPVGHVRAETSRGAWYALQGALGRLEVLDTRGTSEGSSPAGAEGSDPAERAVAIELERTAPDLVLFVVKASDVDSAIGDDLDVLARVLSVSARAHGVAPPVFAVVTQCDVVEPKRAALHDPASADRDELVEKQARIAELEAHLEGHLRARGDIWPHVRGVRGVSSYMSFTATGAVRADERWRVDDLLRRVHHLLPEASRGTFARIARVRALQEALADDLTRATAALAAGVAAVPIPVADILPITGLQLVLVSAIAWLSGRELDARSVAELLAALGANVGVALAMREGARAIAKSVFPGAGSMVSSAVAFAGTMAIGAAATTFFLRGGDAPSVRRSFEDARGPTDETLP